MLSIWCRVPTNSIARCQTAIVWKRRHSARSTAAVFGTVVTLLTATASGAGSEAGAQMSAPESAVPRAALFSDGFETARSWQTFEEIVAGSACYGSEIGQVVPARDAARTGSYGLRVEANAAWSARSDHVVAHRRISGSPQRGRVVLSVWASQAATEGLEGETGPEISLQSTARSPTGEYVTTIAGVQHLAN